MMYACLLPQAIAELVKLPLLEELVKLLYLVADDEAERVAQQQATAAAAGGAPGGQQQQQEGAAATGAGTGEFLASTHARLAGHTGQGLTPGGSGGAGSAGVPPAAPAPGDLGLQQRIAQEQERVVLEEFLGIFTPVSTGRCKALWPV
jgi:hypothetical protein